jgi:hypothetical protein
MMDSYNSSSSFPDIAILDTAVSTAMQQVTLSGVSKIETLPNEVLHAVLGNLPLSDLKEFRLTSKALSTVPVEHIFKHLQIITHPESTCRFGNIANKR